MSELRSVCQVKYFVGCSSCPVSPLSNWTDRVKLWYKIWRNRMIDDSEPLTLFRLLLFEVPKIIIKWGREVTVSVNGVWFVVNFIPNWPSRVTVTVYVTFTWRIALVIRAPSSCPLPTTTTLSNDAVVHTIKSALLLIFKVKKTVSTINMPHVILLTLLWQEMDSWTTPQKSWGSSSCIL